MAEAIGVAASIATFVEISIKVASLCMDHAKKVKNADDDIRRLLTKIEGIATLAEDIQEQIKNSVQKRLDPSTRRKFMSSIGLRLKWPFESKDVDKIILDLEKCKTDISLALQLDTTLVLDIREHIDLRKIPSAPGAAFDAHISSDELDARCHPETRKDLLLQLKTWAEDPQGKSIFWLNGIVGTGKSTISRTVAQSFEDDGVLGASFFFKRGENERQNTSKFFTIITTQLLRKLPGMIPHVRTAIDEEPEIAAKTLEKQFDFLVSNLLQTSI
ncbi:hypothetical protein TWF788_003263 [Orbilia oligospora]|uniref:Nephrocystin 3-like N-terminal domain-containing protein n=1 Tax=Orbilia oligospora TaxID=2813651 RepID=A0A7C8U137_ORBOL|nr:hypothetical protein TWF788_003263 [Orbilia oligospora]